MLIMISMVRIHSVQYYINQTNSLTAFGVVLLEIGLWEPILNVLLRHIGGKPVAKIGPDDAKAGLLAACRAEVDFKCGGQVRRMIEMCLESNFDVGKDLDTSLQTNAQTVFRRDILDRLLKARMAISA